MLNPDQILAALNDLRFCAECHRELDPEREACSQCYECDELLCRKCSRCACERAAGR